LLDEQKRPEGLNWIIACKDGFILSGLCSPEKKIGCTADTIRITLRDGFFYLNGKRFLKKQFFIQPKADFLRFGKNDYRGSFLVVAHQGGAQLINCVELENYVFAVLRSESWPGWPLEVNKVFAIVTRSYVISKVLQARRNKKNFHIKNTRIHQTYNGHNFMIRNSKILQQAVDETEKVFLEYNDEPIVAMFDSCCGGIVPSKVKGVDFDKAPYLARNYPCKHCKRCKLYHWKMEYSLQEWTKLLRKKFPKLKKLRGIKVISRDDAGLIQEVEVIGRKQHFSLTGKELYSLLDAVKSFCFFIRKNGKNILLRGRGYGHHMGLCQWGAREMVRDEWDYKKILEFYYSGVMFVRLA